VAICVAKVNFLKYFSSKFGNYVILVYCFDMNYLILMLVLTISAQPLQAGFCDMDMSQEVSHHSEQAADTGHDCCNSEDSESQPGCDGNMYCGSCSANVSALPRSPGNSTVWTQHHSPGNTSGVVLPSHSSPPFRPPIS
jgi:hypothetical protein